MKILQYNIYNYKNSSSLYLKFCVYKVSIAVLFNNLTIPITIVKYYCCYFIIKYFRLITVDNILESFNFTKLNFLLGILFIKNK